MSPVIPVIITVEAIAAIVAVISTVVLTAAIIGTVGTILIIIVSHTGEGPLSEEDRKKLDEYQTKLKELYGKVFKFNSPSLPQSDVIFPGEDGFGYRMPVELNPVVSEPMWKSDPQWKGGLKGGTRGGFNPRPRIIITNPDGTVRLPNGRFLWPWDFWFPGNCKPSDDDDFYGPPWRRRDDSFGPGGPPPMPLIAAAGQMLNEPAVVYNTGMAGGVEMWDQGDVGLFQVRWAQRSAAVKLVNNTGYVFVIGNPNSASATKVPEAWAAHGCVMATSAYCFPGQAIQLGGFSKGAGVEVYFRISVWQIPRAERDESVDADIKKVDPSLEAYRIDRTKGAKAVQVANLYVFLDVPWAGWNKINALETAPDVVKDLTQKGDDLTGKYEKYHGDTHSSDGEKLKVVYHIDKGENPAGELRVSAK
ncbi:hypothetical protein GGR53DRAFT_467072 [Hypoxylon sp. FL1150]|nr:hypothetical protein GGR53DRAFT_467072 [Hypoxylon sp. FL1150]